MRKRVRQVKALVTLFYPKAEQKENIRNIAKQADTVYLCDNSPKSSRELFQDMKNVQYFHWGENRGLSKAFNTVLKNPYIEWEDTDFVLFFDQDTVIPDNHIEKLIQEFQELCRNGKKPGCIGPVYYNTVNSRLEIPHHFVSVSEKNISVKSIITTSMLCRYRELRKAGFWNEQIFLDMADWDLCWRFMQMGYLCCMTFASIIRHAVGEAEKKIGPFSLRVGRPVREYYELRDCRYLLQKRYVPVKFKIRFILMLCLRCPLHLVFYDNRAERLRYMVKAGKDYKRRVTGAL